MAAQDPPEAAGPSGDQPEPSGYGDTSGSGGASSWGGSPYVDDRPVGSPPEWVLPTSGASPPPPPDESAWAPPSDQSDQSEWAPPAPTGDETAVQPLPPAPPWSSDTGVIDIPTHDAGPADGESPSPGVDEVEAGWSDGSSTSTVDADELTSAEVWLESDEGHDDGDVAASLGAPSMASPDLDELWGDEPDDTVVPPTDSAADAHVDVDAHVAVDAHDGPADEAEPEAAVDPGWSAPTMPVEPPADMPDDASEEADAEDVTGEGDEAGEHPSDVILERDAPPVDDEWLDTHAPEIDGDDDAEEPSAATDDEFGEEEVDASDDDLEPVDDAPEPDDILLPPPPSGAMSPPPMGSPSPPLTPPPAPGTLPAPDYAPPGPPPSPSYAPSAYPPPPAPPSYAPPPQPAPQAPPPPPASGYGQPGYPQTPAPPTAAANPDPAYLGAAVQRVSPAARAAAKGALTLAAHLVNGQRVEGVVVGRLRGATAAAVLTDQQLLLVNDQEWQPTVERLAVDSTLQVQGWDTGATVAMIFTSGGRPLELESIPDKQVAYEFAARIQARTGSQ